jgi:cytochrome c-type biogenesis protein CcmH/NrfG
LYHKGIVHEAQIIDIEERHGPQLKKMAMADKKMVASDNNLRMSLDYANKALQIFKDALVVDETHIESRFHLAMLLHKTFDLGEARRHFTEVAKQRPEDETVLH